MAFTPCQQKTDSSFVQIDRVQHTTESANIYEQAGSFTITEPMVVEIKTNYGSSAPTGLAISASSGGAGFDYSFAKNEYVPYNTQDPSYKRNLTGINVTTFLEAGTYYVFTRYMAVGSNIWTAYGLKIS